MGRLGLDSLSLHRSHEQSIGWNTVTTVALCAYYEGQYANGWLRLRLQESSYTSGFDGVKRSARRGLRPLGEEELLVAGLESFLIRSGVDSIFSNLICNRQGMHPSPRKRRLPLPLLAH